MTRPPPPPTPPQPSHHGLSSPSSLSLSPSGQRPQSLQGPWLGPLQPTAVGGRTHVHMSLIFKRIKILLREKKRKEKKSTSPITTFLKGNFYLFFLMLKKKKLIVLLKMCILDKAIHWRKGFSKQS